MNAKISYNKNATLDNGQSVCYNVTYVHPELGRCSEFYRSKQDAEKRVDCLRQLGE